MAGFDSRETFPLGRVAIGLSDLLGAKTWPKNPHLMNAELQHTFDASNLYLFAKRFGANFGTSVAGVGPTQTTTIPANEAWWVEVISASATVIAGATLRLQNHYSETLINPGANVATYGPTSGLVGAGFLCAVGWDVRRWLGPGTIFLFNVAEATGIGAGQSINWALSGSRVTL